MNYKKLNNLTGWIVFLIATAVYFLTLESTASLWDCGEYITAAYKLEVGHPPGAPLFMVLGRLFSFFADPSEVAVWINRLSALSSSFTILFLFWSITLFGKKIIQRKSKEWTKGDQIAVLGAGVVGALAYTFSDSFWFSAVEGEVYAMSSLFTAAIFWMILKWDEEMIAIKSGEISGEHSPFRWMILIWFMFGLAIGVHLLGLLVVPSIAFVIYFNYVEKPSLKGIILTGLASIAVLGFVQEGIIPGSVAMASWFEVTFVNSFGLPFFSGTLFFFIILIFGFYWGFKYAKRKMKPLLTTILWSLAFLLIGYGSFAVIVIRSNANTPLDENDPENLVTLHAYLKREQYGSWPILNGPYWNSKPASADKYGDASPFYLRRFVVVNSSTSSDVKAFIHEKDAQDWAKKNGPRFEVQEKYFSSNESVRKNSKEVYEQTTFLPRMYYTSANPRDPKIQGYKNWSGYDPTVVTDFDEKGTDGLRLPTFGENLNYLFSYQLNWMYWRYFMWNFSGRQNDIQGHGDEMRGNWISGYSFIDNARLGNQEHAPYFTTENKAHNNFWMLPLIFGVIGLVFHFYRAPKDAFVVFLTFFFTGIAIVIYLNQKPGEPRERDYAYAASFYAFAFWIGLSVLALYDVYKNFTKPDWVNTLKGFAYLSAFILLFAIGGGSTIFITWIVIALIALFILGIAFALRKVLANQQAAAFGITAIACIVPYIMGQQGWDDHNRSGKTSARDLAYNYLQSCAKNGIIFSVGDNDTFPLWYLQEVEGKRTDVRVCNTSLFDTDWYTNQMKMKMYESDPLPISFREDQILMYAGGTDQALFLTTSQMLAAGINREAVESIFNKKVELNKAAFTSAYDNLLKTVTRSFETVKAKDPSIEPRIAQLKQGVVGSAENATLDNIESIENNVMEIFDAYRNGLIDAEVSTLEQLQKTLTSWETSWSYLPVKDAMEFMKDDANMFKNGRMYMRAVPTSGFILPVNKENALKSEIISKDEAANCANEIRFSFNIQSTSYITKSDIMILDMLANNDWKRAMYFTSPGNTSVSTAIYQSGHLRANGMAWEISPVLAQSRTPINEKLMFKHLMETYEYGDLKNPDVLTDYYARRQITQFRTMFLQLAEFYVTEADRIEMNKQQYEPMIQSLRASGQTKTADSLENSFATNANLPAEYRKKAVAVIKKSLEVMPARIVFDYGESPSTGEPYTDANGAQQPSYHEGVLQSYVSILFRAGDSKAAEELGIEVASQLESIMDYFNNSDAKFAGKNIPDYAAAVGNYANLYQFVMDPSFKVEKGALAQRLQARFATLYKTELPRIYNELDQMSIELGEIRNQGTYTVMAAQLKGIMNAIDLTYNITGTQVPNKNNNSFPMQGNEAVLNEDVLKNVQPSDDSIL